MSSGAKITDSSLNQAVQKAYPQRIKSLLLQGKCEGTFNLSWQQAIENGDAEVVEFLLNAGIPVKRGYLYTAVKWGHLEVVKLFLATKEKATKFDLDEVALYSACQNGHIQIIKLLLAAGANVNADVFLGPLHASVARGDVEVVKILLGAGAKVTDDCLNEAILKGNTTIVRLLREAKMKSVGLLAAQAVLLKPSLVSTAYASKLNSSEGIMPLVAGDGASFFNNGNDSTPPAVSAAVGFSFSLGLQIFGDNCCKSFRGTRTSAIELNWRPIGACRIAFIYRP